MNILDEIVAYKQQEVAQRKMKMPVAKLKDTTFFSRPTLSLRQSLLDTAKTGIIAEFKRKSPSKGMINSTAAVPDVVASYKQYGACGVSVLTDNHFFGGAIQDLEAARTVAIPILRKEFIIDSFQVTEAKSIGADVILLIAAILTPQQVQQFSAEAHELGLEVILEVHDEKELAHICPDVDIVGVNNRNLKTFKVDLEQSVKLSASIPGDKVKITESGIHKVEDIHYLRSYGFQGFLIGENFMKQSDPGEAFAHFAQQLKQPAV